MWDKFDGSEKVPREVQKKALKFIEEKIQTHDVIGLNLPCGSGKSAIARAVMLEYKDATYITSNNMLIKQMQEFYPDINALIGKKHYTCSKNPQWTCEDAWKLKSHKPCGQCEYYAARKRALEGRESTCYNAISYWYAMKDPRWKAPKVIVVDEADKLIDTLMLISGETFGKSYNPPKNLDFIEIVGWLKEKERVLTEYVNKAPIKDALRGMGELNKVQRMIECITDSPSSYAHDYDEKGDLVVYPISPPSEIIDKILQADKLILMSATLYKSDIPKLTSKTSAYLELDSPIDEARRRITLQPPVYNMTWQTDPELVAMWILDMVKKYPFKGTIVHVTYALSKKLRKYIQEAYVNTPEDKAEVLSRFKEEGGIWLASGCSDGLDLRDDYAGLNLIPILPNPNVADPVQKRRLALPGGLRDYHIGVLRVVQQMAGRSTRHEEDYSRIIIGDKRFKDLVQRYHHELPNSFTDSINWG